MRWFGVLATLALAACDAIGVGGPSADARVSGRVESEVPAAAAVPEGWAAITSSGSAGAQTVEVVEVNGGSYRTLATATVNVDGSYTVEGVPAGREHLMVVARSSGGAEVGSVLLAGETESDETVWAGPINAQSTLEGRVYTSLRGSGQDEDEVSSGELALMLHMDQQLAAASARSDAAVRAFARAYIEARESSTRAFGRIGGDLSVEAREHALANGYATYQTSLAQGASASAAFDTFARGWASAMAHAGASAEATVLASAAARQGIRASLAGSAADDRAEAAMEAAAARLNLIARLELAGKVGAEASSERSRVEASIAAALERLRFGASSSAQVREVMVSAGAQAATGLRAELFALASGAGLTSVITSTLTARTDAALAEADLTARLEAAADATARAAAVADYRTRVEAAARAYAEAAPAHARIGAEAMADLLVAARAG
jgi:hypothetical protein